MSDLVVRSAHAADAADLAVIYHRAVREGAAPKYTASERAAWSGAPPSGPDWVARLTEADTLLAERQGAPVGFMSRKGDLIDLAFVLPEERGQGTADAVYAVLEGRARAEGIRCLNTHASLMAEPFFARHGWQVRDREVVTRAGVPLRRASMTKLLRGACAA